MVELQAATTHGTVTLIGVAVAEGGMVVTTADLLGGVQRIDMVGPGGKLEQASVVGTDATSNVALVNVPADVPVAPFSDDGALGGGAPDTALSYVPAGGSSVAFAAHRGHDHRGRDREHERRLSRQRHGRPSRRRRASPPRPPASPC